MEKSELDSRLNSIAERFYTLKPVGLLGSFGPPFDISKPNFHDSKPDFLAEMNAVVTGLKNVDGLIEFLTAGIIEEGPVDAEVSDRLKVYLDANARQENRDHKVEFGYDIVRRNSSEVGLTMCITFQLLDLRRGLVARRRELDDQEAEFWSGKSRPPNHFARTIALRFARCIANNTQKKPTFGTSRDGGHPSTDFGRALEEIFALLKIKANVKNAATWAISQLTDADIHPPQVNALNALTRNQFRRGLGAIRPEGELKELLKKAPKP